MQDRQQERYLSVSVDLDHESDYATVYGIHSFTPKGEYLYLQGLPRILKLLDEFKAKATFFVVGRDVGNRKRLRVLRAILEQGHEISNHTYSHYHNFHKLDSKMKSEEIEKAHEAVWRHLRYKMVGFRAPGYNIDSETLRILKKLGYWYDSSVHPTIAHPLLRLALYWKTRERASLASMGPLSVITAPLEPYRCALTSIGKVDQHSQLIEIPITVFPRLRLPLFGTIHLALGSGCFLLLSPLLQRMSTINFEMHGIDLADKPSGNFSWFARHPGMRKTARDRGRIYREILNWFSQGYQFAPLKTITEMVRKSSLQ